MGTALGLQVGTDQEREREDLYCYNPATARNTVIVFGLFRLGEGNLELGKSCHMDVRGLMPGISGEIPPPTHTHRQTGTTHRDRHNLVQVKS